MVEAPGPRQRWRTGSWPERVFERLPNEISTRIFNHLPGNEIACTLRLVCVAAAAQFSGPEHRVVHISQPAPCQAYAARWGSEDGIRTLTHDQKRELVQLTVRSGVATNVKVAIEASGAREGAALDTAFEAASGVGDLALVKWCWQRMKRGREIDHNVKEQAVEAAATHGHLDVLRWMRLQRLAVDADMALEKAGMAGHTAVVEYMLGLGGADDNDSRRRVDVACLAAMRGHEALSDRILALLAPQQPDVTAMLACAAVGYPLAGLQRVWSRLVAEAGRAVDQPDEWEAGCVVEAAAASPTPDYREKVEWLIGKGAPVGVLGCDEPPCDLLESHDFDAFDTGLVADGGERLRWLKERGFSFEDEVVDAAAAQGKLDVMLFLLEGGGMEVSHEGIELAAERGHLHILQALHGRGADMMVVSTLDSAARNGQLEVVAWLLDTVSRGARGAPRTRSNPHPGDKYITVDLVNAAVESSNLQLVAWLLERKPKAMDHTTFETAASDSSEEMVEFLAARGCAMGNQGVAYEEPASRGDRSMLRCLHRLGCPWGPPGRALSAAVRGGCELATLKWMLAEPLAYPMDARSWAITAARTMVGGWRVRAGVKVWAVRQARAAEAREKTAEAAKAQTKKAAAAGKKAVPTKAGVKGKGKGGKENGTGGKGAGGSGGSKGRAEGGMGAGTGADKGEGGRR